ncbi:DeoR/GlpR family DNA-binding transcription regulator [Chelativorans sp.]|uniref:DeoR/GlpR family DNA-binding transcription regulator n=1 Tax=Chelativorans sp. TaxID=2203393 RepID=UPI002811F831|nr:DeoR/GlpR family DNA-binding transcription regulator [Chelativorans sp.]
MNLDAKALMQSERLAAVLAEIETQGRITVTDAASRFGVSAETVRRDLKLLASDRRVQLVRGGAILARSSTSPALQGEALPSVEFRVRSNEAEKDAIGRHAAELVADGQVVLLDGGTTTLSVARHLKPRRNLTVVTNNLLVAQEIGRRPGWRVHVIGGELSPLSMSLVGLSAVQGLQNVAVDIAFLGAAGVSATGGFTSPDPFESELKRGMMAIARRVVVVADHTKLTTSGFAAFATPEKVDVFVTSKGAREEMLQPFRRAGVEIIVARSEARHDD